MGFVRRNSRRLRIVRLEERALLAVISGYEQAAELPGSTGCTTWVVNTTDDPANWSETDNSVSLREAISRSAAGDVITLKQGELVITKCITIDATSNSMFIYAAGDSRVIRISGGNASNPVCLIELYIYGGEANCKGDVANTSGSGGGIYNSGLYA